MGSIVNGIRKRNGNARIRLRPAATGCYGLLRAATVCYGLLRRVREPTARTNCTLGPATDDDCRVRSPAAST